MSVLESLRRYRLSGHSGDFIFFIEPVQNRKRLKLRLLGQVFGGDLKSQDYLQSCSNLRSRRLAADARCWRTREARLRSRELRSNLAFPNLASRQAPAGVTQAKLYRPLKQVRRAPCDVFYRFSSLFQAPGDMWGKILISFPAISEPGTGYHFRRVEGFAPKKKLTDHTYNLFLVTV